VGDCHYHAISAKWTNLQGHALRVVEECPDLVHKVHYESILQDKATVVSGVYDFIGERRFGGVKRQASVMFMRPTVDLIDGARKGREAHKARRLSCQFQNLGRGDSFANRQNKKWADPETGLDKEALQLIESVAHEMMKRLGYDPSLVGVLAEATVFTEGDLKHFDELNKLGIEKMNQDLQKENPGDFNRRQHQAETLNFPPILLDEGDSYSAAGDSYTTDGHESLFDMSFHDLDFDGRLETVAESVIELHDGRCFRAATATQRGYYPDEPEKPNQDETKIQVGILNSGSVHWFSVFDGHGPDGHKCSELASQKIPELFLCECDTSGGDIKAALNTAHMDTHKVMLADPTIDSSQSGTTAVTLLLGNDNKCFISNVGDSACILGSRTSYGATVAKPLCTEQTPFRADERERIKKAGGLIMTVDQRDGLVPINEDWDRSEPPPRIWTNRNDKFPGCGFTRSIGDSVAHTIGVTARPEIFEHTLAKNDCVLIVASDGVTECMISCNPQSLCTFEFVLTPSLLFFLHFFHRDGRSDLCRDCLQLSGSCRGGTGPY
jgi:cGMP-dependent protein kinase